MKFYKHILFLIFFSILIPGTDGTIRGKVTDEDGTALVGTQIYIPELEKGAAADIDGNFILLNISVGTYEVRFLMIGYQTKVMENVGVVMDQTQWLNVSLPEASVEGEVVYVSSERALVEKGANVLITGRSEARLQEARLYTNADVLEFDIADFDNISNNAKKCLDLFDNRVDVLVNNAGIGVRSSIEELSIEIF